MKQNAIKNTSAEGVLKDLENLRQELHKQKHGRAAVEERLANLQRLLESMAHNFPDGMICVLNRDLKNVLSDGKNFQPAHGTQGTTTYEPSVEIPVLLANPEMQTKLRKAFTGESVQAEVTLNGRFYHVTGVPLTDDHHAINEVLCVMQDFTKRKSMEEGLIKALEKEKELGELKSRFVTMASHEFRTPLTTILSSTFLIENLNGENSEKEKKTHTNRIKRAVNNLTLILNEFLSLEKLEQNKVEVVTSDVNIPEYIQDTLSEMEVLKRERQIIEYHHSGEQWIVRIDHHLLWSIVTNLISNALKYSKVGDKIEISSQIDDHFVLFKVKDPGIGIPADEQQFIFGRFYRARNAINYEGTGLGLHIIQKYIHLLKGTITFESKLDLGTSFTVRLPIVLDEPSASQASL